MRKIVVSLFALLILSGCGGTAKGVGKGISKGVAKALRESAPKAKKAAATAAGGAAVIEAEDAHRGVRGSSAYERLSSEETMKTETELHGVAGDQVM